MEIIFHFALTKSAFISLSSLSRRSYGEHQFEMSKNASQLEKGTWRESFSRVKGSCTLFSGCSLGFKLGTKQFLF